jgi:hypothetical protein
MDKLPLEIQTLYAELLERLVALEAQRSIGSVPGCFVTKEVRGESYYYFQLSEPGGAKRQIYLGRKDAVLGRIAARHRAGRGDHAGDEASIQRLCTLLRAGGAQVTDAPSARVLRALAGAGVFRLDGLLVGTHAFVVLGNILGARWGGSWLRTQDIDIAAGTSLSIAVPEAPATSRRRSKRSRWDSCRCRSSIHGVPRRRSRSGARGSVSIWSPRRAIHDVRGPWRFRASGPRRSRSRSWIS